MKVMQDVSPTIDIAAVTAADPLDDEEKAMLLRLKYALPFAGFVALQPAQAQMLGPFRETYVTLTGPGHN